MIPPLLRRDARFRRFWGAQSVSLVGDQISTLALPLVAVLELDADAAQMGYLAAAGLAPNLLFSLHLGAWVDRRGKRRQTMMLADLGRFLLLATIPLAFALDGLTLWHLYVVALGVGTLGVAFNVSYSTLFTTLVRREHYLEANQVLAGTRAFSFMAGPSAGGVLVQALTAPVAIVADACSYLVSALFLRSIHAEEPETEPAAKGHIAAGWRFIRATPVIFASLLSTAWINFFNFVVHALLVLYVTRELGIEPGLLGAVLGAGAVGGLVGSVVTGRISRRLGIGPTFILGSFLFAAPFLLIPAAGGPKPVVLGLLFLMEFGAGFGVMVLDISAAAIQQSMIPDRLRARVAGAYMVVNYGVRPLGALAGGWLGATLGLRETLWFAAIGGLASVLFLLPSPIPRLAELPATAPAD